MPSQALIDALVADLTSEANRRRAALESIPELVAADREAVARVGDFGFRAELSPLAEARNTVVNADRRIQCLAKALAHVALAGPIRGEFE